MTIRSNFVIRDYKPGDFPGLDELWKETGMGGPERGDDAETIERCNNLGGKLIVMTDADGTTIIGSSWMTFDGRRIYLHHFGIKPEYQGKGLGKILAVETLRFIKLKGHQVKLEVHKDNLRAKRLYEQFGFFPFSDYDIYMIRDTQGIDV